MKTSCKIVLNGPESTAKSTLTKQLAKHYRVPYMPEYAREYLAAKATPNYTFEDIEHIARKQFEQHRYIYKTSAAFVIFDTDIIITKIWFQEVFGKVPPYIDQLIWQSKPNLYLVTYPDIKWEADAVRENGTNQRRKLLFEKYVEEIQKIKVPFRVIKGAGESRLQRAMTAISDCRLSGC